MAVCLFTSKRPHFGNTRRRILRLKIVLIYKFNCLEEEDGIKMCSLTKNKRCVDWDIKFTISEVRKCSRLFTHVNSLIDQLHHCVVGTC